MIQLSGITWMLMHNAIFGLGASCHTRGKLSYYINGAWSVEIQLIMDMLDIL